MILFIDVYCCIFIDCCIKSIEFVKLQIGKMIQNQIMQLDLLLSNFLEVSTDPLVSNRAARQLCQISERQGFLETAIHMMSSYELGQNKMILLSCMVKDCFKYCFELIEGEKMNDYYLMLISLARKMGVRNKALFKNIAQSLAIIYINAEALGHIPLSTFLEPFESQLPNLDDYYYYFKILEYCASEVSNSKIVLEEQFRQNAKKSLIDQQSLIIQQLDRKAEAIWSYQEVDKDPIIQCFDRWIQLTHNSELLNSLPELFLFKYVVSSLQDEDYVSSAVSLLKTVVYTIKNKPQNQRIYMVLLDLVSKLIRFIEETAFKLNGEHVELLIVFIAKFAKKFAENLVRAFSPQVRDLIIIPLIKFIYTRLEGAVDAIIEFEESILKAAIEAKKESWLQPEFKVIPLTILLSLADTCQYPQQLIKELDNIAEYKLGSHHHEGQIIHRYRLNAGKVFDSLAELMGINVYVNEVVKFISILNSSEVSFWSKFESLLNSLPSPISKLEQITQNANTLFLVNTYEQLSSQSSSVHILIKRTFLRLFKSLFSIKNMDKNLVMKMFFYITQCLDTPLLFDDAERAYFRGCQEYAAILSILNSSDSKVDQMFEMVRHYPGEEYIARGYICVVCVKEETACEGVSKCLHHLFYCFTDEMASHAKKKEYLNVLTGCIKQLKNHKFIMKNAVVKSFTSQALPFLLHSLKHPKSKVDDEDLHIERIVKLIKSIMRLLNTEFECFLEDLFVCVTKTFQEYPICSFLYLVEITITVFYNQKNAERFLVNLYQNVCNSAFNHLKIPQNIDKYGYLVDDFLGMSSRLITYKTSIIIESHQFPKLLNFVSGDCLQTSTPKVIKATYGFLQTVFMLYWTEESRHLYCEAEGDEALTPLLSDPTMYIELKGYLLQQMENIVHHMLQHLSEMPSELARESILDALLSEIKAFPDQNPEIWKEIINKISPDVLVKEQKDYMKNLLFQMKKRNQNRESIVEVCAQLNTGLQLISKRMSVSEKRRQFKLQFK